MFHTLNTTTKASSAAVSTVQKLTLDVRSTECQRWECTTTKKYPKTVPYQKNYKRNNCQMQHNPTIKLLINAPAFICTLDKNTPVFNRDPVFICILYKWQNTGTHHSGKLTLTWPLSMVPDIYLELAFIGDLAIIRYMACICTLNKNLPAFNRDLLFIGDSTFIRSFMVFTFNQPIHMTLVWFKYRPGL